MLIKLFSFIFTLASIGYAIDHLGVPVNDIENGSHETNTTANKYDKRVSVKSNIIYSDYQATLDNGSEIDSGWLDMEGVDKVQFSGNASAAGMTMTIESRANENQTALSTSVTYTDGTFYMFNVICRQRYMRFKWANNTGAQVTNVSMEIKQSFGSSDKLSVFPVGVNPTVFSQAGLVQSIVRGQQPDGDYEAIPVDGTAISTTTSLGPDETYTSAWTDSDGWNSIDIFFDSDVVSAFQGVVIEFTDDAQATSPSVRGSLKYTFTEEMVENGFESIKIPVSLDGFRIKYTNGPTAQASFYLDATLRTNADNIKLNKGGAALVSSFDTEVALGLVANYELGTKFGRVKSIDAADSPVDIWAFADDAASPRANTKTFPTSSFTPYLASSSASDTNVDVHVFYIDSDGFADEATVNLNGQSSVSLGVSALDVNSMTVSGSVSAVGNVYAITADNFTGAGVPATPSQTVAVMPAGYNQTQLSHFTVPRGKKMIIKNYNIDISRGSGAAGSAELRLLIREFGGVVKVVRELFPTSSVPARNPEVNLVVPPRGQLIWRLHDVSDNDTNASAIWSYELIDI